MTAPAEVVAAYEAALPDDPRVKRKQMFGSPCAFVNRQMFFGTFESSFVARIGPRRAKRLAESEANMTVFSPREGQQWDDYVQVAYPADEKTLSDLAIESRDWAAALPKKHLPPKIKNLRKNKD